MAIVTTNDLIEGIRGKLGKSLVFRTMHDKTFVSQRARKPDKRKESEAQRNTRVNFKQASEWAKRIVRDPERKAYYQKRAKALKLPNAYTAAITDYMRKPKVFETRHGKAVMYAIHKPGFTVKQVRLTTNETTDWVPNITTRQHKDCWFIQYTPGVSKVSSLTLIITDNSGRNTESNWRYPDVGILKSS